MRRACAGCLVLWLLRIHGAGSARSRMSKIMIQDRPLRKEAIRYLKCLESTGEKARTDGDR